MQTLNQYNTEADGIQTGTINMIRHKLILKDNRPETLNGKIEITYKGGTKEDKPEKVVSPGDAAGLCVIRCFGAGVTRCDFYLDDGTLVAYAENI
jgi:hypothetical protein